MNWNWCDHEALYWSVVASKQHKHGHRNYEYNISESGDVSSKKSTQWFSAFFFFLFFSRSIHQRRKRSSHGQRGHGIVISLASTLSQLAAPEIKRHLLVSWIFNTQILSVSIVSNQNQRSYHYSRNWQLWTWTIVSLPTWGHIWFLLLFYVYESSSRI